MYDGTEDKAAVRHQHRREYTPDQTEQGNQADGAGPDDSASGREYDKGDTGKDRERDPAYHRCAASRTSGLSGNYL